LGYPEGVKEAFAKEMDLHARSRVTASESGGCCLGAQRRSRAGEVDGKIRDVFWTPPLPTGVMPQSHWSSSATSFVTRTCDGGADCAVRQRGAGAQCLVHLGQLQTSRCRRPAGRVAGFICYRHAPRRAYAIRHLRSVTPATQEKLLAAVKRESTGSKARVFLVAAAGVHAPPDARALLRADLVTIVDKGSNDDKIEAIQALGQVGDASDLSQIIPLLDDPLPTFALLPLQRFYESAAAHRITWSPEIGPRSPCMRWECFS